MIRYDLRCSRDHDFDAWFRNSDGFETLRKAGEVTCPICGDARVTKALMTPAIGRAPEAPAPRKNEPAPKPVLSAPETAPLAQALKALRNKLESEATYVGRRFAEEARRQHVEETPPAPIWGEATAAEAEALIDDGVPIAPLPPLPRRDD